MRRFGFVIGLCWLSLQTAMAAIVLTGRVTDENNTAVSGASISVTTAAARGEATVLRALSDHTGGFQLLLPLRGLYLVSVEREGYFRIEKRSVEVQDEAAEINLSLVRVKTLAESVNVKASLPGIDFDTTSTETTLIGKEMVDIPYPTTNNLKNALALSPRNSPGCRWRHPYQWGTREPGPVHTPGV
jgi:hypothetical protein